MILINRLCTYESELSFLLCESEFRKLLSHIIYFDSEMWSFTKVILKESTILNLFSSIFATCFVQRSHPSYINACAPILFHAVLPPLLRTASGSSQLHDGFSICYLPGNFATADYITTDNVNLRRLMGGDIYWDWYIAMFRKSSPFRVRYDTLIWRLHQTGLMKAWENQVCEIHSFFFINHACETYSFLFINHV